MQSSDRGARMASRSHLLYASMVACVVRLMFSRTLADILGLESRGGSKMVGV